MVRFSIVSDTTRTVRPVSEGEVYGEDEDCGGWYISIDCPVFGLSLSGIGRFEDRDAAMDSIRRGEY